MSAVFCNVPALRFSLRLDFENEETVAPILDAVSGALSGVRLPSYDFAAEPAYDVSDSVAITASVAGDAVEIAFAGAVETATFASPLVGLHWDFWKLVTAIVSKRLLERGLVTFHAACFEHDEVTYLVPGGSGAGKSSLSYQARSVGARVYASELCFVAGTKIVAGNATLSIDADAITALAMPAVAAEPAERGKLLIANDHLAAPRRVDAIVFPKVTAGGCVVRQISARRTRMLLYENAIGQTAIAQLIDEQTTPVLLLPTARDLAVIALATRELAAAWVAMVEGSPSEIFRELGA